MKGGGTVFFGFRDFTSEYNRIIEDGAKIYDKNFLQKEIKKQAQKGLSKSQGKNIIMASMIF